MKDTNVDLPYQPLGESGYRATEDSRFKPGMQT